MNALKDRVYVDDDAVLYIMAIGRGELAPLSGFCTEKDYRSIVDRMRLASGETWPIPITLAVDDDTASKMRKKNRLELFTRKKAHIASMDIEDLFRVDAPRDVIKTFGTGSKAHPGVLKELNRPPWRIGGRIRDIKPVKPLSGKYFKAPDQIKKEIKKSGWKNIAGFQTRNPVHTAHEHLQKVALEICDGIFIQPLVGWRRDGDFSIEAIFESYRIMLDKFYPKHKVIFGTLEIPMHYAGPREAILHAIVRRNYGCTHFIVGRDHAGVGDHYDKYEAQELAKNTKGLGIEILGLKSPFYCVVCGDVVTENTCPHHYRHSREISGTIIRKRLKALKAPPEYMMRRRISDALVRLAKKGRAFNNNEK